jgi:hypothetical protein
METGAQKRGANIDKDISALRRSIDPMDISALRRNIDPHGHLCLRR